VNDHLTRRLFLKRASSALGVVAFLPAIGKAAVRRKPYTAAYYEHTIVAMGATARVGVYADSEQLADTAINAAFAELTRLEKIFSVFDPASELSKLNQFAGNGMMPVSHDLFSIIRSAVEYSARSQGAFDITVEPLMRLWGFRDDPQARITAPTAEEIHSALQFVGTHHIALNASTNGVALESAGCKLDLGGIAVGYALDRMREIMLSHSIATAFIDISGDILAMGAPVDNEAGWQVAIPNPDLSGELIYRTTLRDTALATSGNYMNFVVYHAQKYGHIMSPTEGASAHAVQSSTAMTSTGIEADALSTASFVLGEAIGNDRFVFVSNQGVVREA